MNEAVVIHITALDRIVKTYERRFPVYPTHGVVRMEGCPFCHSQWEDVLFELSGKPSGSGEYKIRCSYCGFTRWYDLWETADLAE